jgi:metal-dependent amidase/aminoacylase/carboxypeptidase family protein
MSELIGRTVPADQHLAELQKKLFDQPVTSKEEAAQACARIRQELETHPGDVASLSQALKTGAVAGLAKGAPDDSAKDYAELALLDLATAPVDGQKQHLNQAFSDMSMALMMDQQNAALAAQRTHVDAQDQHGTGWVANLSGKNLNPSIAVVADYVQTQLPPNLHLIRPAS